MKISIKLLATYRKYLPEGVKGNSCEIEISSGSSVVDVLDLFDISYDEINVILVNGQVPDPNHTLEDGDVVCAFPAIAGG